LTPDPLVKELLSNLWAWMDAEKEAYKFGRDEITLDDYRELLEITYKSRINALKIARKIRRLND
jgi:hypothetical protein